MYGAFFVMALSWGTARIRVLVLSEAVGVVLLLDAMASCDAVLDLFASGVDSEALALSLRRLLLIALDSLFISA